MHRMEYAAGNKIDTLRRGVEHPPCNPGNQVRFAETVCLSPIAPEMRTHIGDDPVIQLDEAAVCGATRQGLQAHRTRARKEVQPAAPAGQHARAPTRRRQHVKHRASHLPGAWSLAAAVCLPAAERPTSARFPQPDSLIRGIEAEQLAQTVARQMSTEHPPFPSCVSCVSYNKHMLTTLHCPWPTFSIMGRVVSPRPDSSNLPAVAPPTMRSRLCTLCSLARRRRALACKCRPYLKCLRMPICYWGVRKFKGFDPKLQKNKPLLWHICMVDCNRRNWREGMKGVMCCSHRLMQSC